jgi:RNA polymerase sigma-70 factor, ECF subfamily
VDGKGDQRSDLELVAAVKRGEWGAFDLLYYRHRDWAYRLAWRFCGSETDAADVVQEVFVYLAGKLRTGLELRAGMTTLLYPAVKHTALAIKRKRGRMGALCDEMEMAAPTIGEDVEGVRRELAAVLGGLSEAHREVLLMRFVDDMTLEEIGVALEVPVGTVKSRLHHGLAAVRENGNMRRFFEA